MTPTRESALTVLRTLVGTDAAEFHDGQFEAISALVDDRRRALVVQRTGWGKSAVYFVATLLLRQRGSGPTILVSPLLALMRDQVAAAARAGVRAVSINSSNAHEWTEVQRMLRDDEVDVLLVSPERLNNPSFRDEQLPDLVARAGLLVVDEAHCISDWGHDFRPDYRRLRDLIAELPTGIPVLATTATANSRVVGDVAEQLAHHASAMPETPNSDEPVLTIRGPLARASLRLGVLRLPTAQARLAWLLSHLDDLPGSGIIYALTVSAAEDTARLLRDAGHEVHAYTGRTDTAEREQLEGRLKANSLKALVATSALGMGFDKPDLGFVLHLGAPSSPVAYYQQVGRAGRATDNADVLLLPGSEDEAIWNYCATASMPREQKALAVIAELGSTPLSTPALEARVDLKRTPLELLLKVLDVDGAVRKVQGGWVSPASRGSTTPTATPASPPPARRSSSRCSTTSGSPPARRAAAWSSSSARSTTTPRCPAGAATTARAPGTRAMWPPTRRPPRRSRSTGSVWSSSRAPSGRTAWTASAWPPRATSRSATGSRRAALWPDSPTSAGAGRCATPSRPVRRMRRRRPRWSPPACGSWPTGAGTNGRWPW